MSISTILACIASLAQFQACDTATGAAVERANLNMASSAASAKGNRLDQDLRGTIVATPVRGAPQPTYSDIAREWSGFYLGGSLGYGFGESRQQLDRGNNHGYDEVSPDGFAGSMTAGYNFVVGSGLVAGIEADVGIMNLSDDDKAVFDAHGWKSQFGPLWGTVRGRLGYLFGDSMLLYGTAGLAFMETDNWTVGNNWNESSWDGKMRTGWVIGAGVEYALTDAWSAKAEYLYMDFGKHHGYTEDADPYWYDDNVSIVRVGVNYRF